MPTNQEMARAVAEWIEPIPTERQYKSHMSRFPMSPKKAWCDTFHGWRPTFSEHSLDCFRIVEAEIERRGLLRQYFETIDAQAPGMPALLGRVAGFSYREYWLGRATAAQKLAAAYAVVQGLEKNDASK